MKAVEFESASAPDGGIEIPQVGVTWDDLDQAWREAGRRSFEGAYSPEDSVYEALIDEAELR